MPNVSRLAHHLRQFEFPRLFNELGWEHPQGDLSVAVGEQTYSLRGIAEKRGVRVFECTPDAADGLPERALRQKIDRQVTQSAYEHLIVYVDGARTEQVWQWVARQPGRPAAYREISYRKGQSGEPLIQKLLQIEFPLDQEESIDLTGVVQRLRDAFDRDRVTKRFYDRFKQQHGAFLGFIEGIKAQGDREWYASLMLNRLMFVYFIQRKGFLDDDPDYLRNRLRRVQEQRGRDQFLTFYRHFLLCLFHEGFAKQPAQRELSAELQALVGSVPYLNGGLFELHELEQHYADIDIPDRAFEQLFAFFDQYEWHLDNRPLRDDREINPDVLGYIFEKYINQKQMGAYYTKEDITEYICKNTVIPRLFDAARKSCAIAFQPDAALWRLLRDNPDAYLYPALRSGVIDADGGIIPESSLPEFVRQGMNDPKARMFNRDYNLVAARLPDAEGNNLALPTETWREYVERRRRCLDIREQLVKGEIHRIDDLITCNLDIRQFAEDAIAGCEGPELLRAFYKSISTVTVLDPTCGSGAFLFAALNILQPLYEACLERMQAFVEDLERSGEPHSPKKYEDFRKILAEVERHPNRDYFVLKSIIVNNLYGVDIMEEAVEICKLRLFLKLVAQIERVRELEPLPDIDFNIRAGNTLIGFTSLDQIREAAARDTKGQAKLLFGEADDAIRRIEEDAEIVERAFRKFHEMQTDYGMDAADFSAAKRELRERLNGLTEQLDRYLAGEYAIDPDKQKKQYAQWRASHQPFHWFAEFYGIMQRGGFDVIVGNPPYLEYSRVSDYQVLSFVTQQCNNLYTMTVERSFSIMEKHARLGMIIPISVACSGALAPLRDLMWESSRTLWLSHFSNRPGQLFTGAQNRLSIVLAANSVVKPSYFSTKYHRWSSRAGERGTLLPILQYHEIDNGLIWFHRLLPKVGDKNTANVLIKIRTDKKIGDYSRRNAANKVYWVRVPGYFCQFYCSPPMATPEKGGLPRLRGEVNTIGFDSEVNRSIAHAVLNSSIYYLFFCIYTDTRHINPGDVVDFPLDISAFTETVRAHLRGLSKDISECFKDNTSKWRKSGLFIDSVDTKPCKEILDRVDCLLAENFRLSPDELDVVINFDIKYRMGLSEGDAP